MNEKDTQSETTIPPVEELDNQEETAPPINDWASAFAALEPVVEEPAEGAGTEQLAAETVLPDATDTGQATTTPPPATGDVSVPPADSTGQLSTADSTGATGTGQPPSIDTRISGITKDIEQQAIKDVHDAFIQRRIRNTNGKLGATINDPDILRKDADGVATFYDPDTGQPFDSRYGSPREQARRWVETYNAELRDSFNQVAQQRIDQLTEAAKPTIEMLKFNDTFEKLDKTRQDMIDAFIEDYEILDNSGNIIGYSCDLNKVLNAVNRQIKRVQDGNQTAEQPAGVTQTQTTQTPPVTVPQSPALDMRTGSGIPSAEGKPEFKSVAEAMEWEQDQQLKALQEKGKR